MSDAQTYDANNPEFIEAIQKADVKIATKVFGDHPQDVINVIDGASEAIGWLEEIFFSIEKEFETKEKDKKWSKLRVQRLAALGKYVAFDYGNYVGSKHEDYRYNLRQTGAIERSEVQS